MQLLREKAPTRGFQQHDLQAASVLQIRVFAALSPPGPLLTLDLLISFSKSFGRDVYTNPGSVLPLSPPPLSQTPGGFKLKKKSQETRASVSG